MKLRKITAPCHILVLDENDDVRECLYEISERLVRDTTQKVFNVFITKGTTEIIKKSMKRHIVYHEPEIAYLTINKYETNLATLNLIELE